MKRSIVLPITIGLFCLLSFQRCGQIVDSANNPIAEMDGKTIRQRTFYRYLRNLPENDRPLIQTKDDLIRALNAYLEDKIILDEGRALLEKGQIQVSREQAKQIYFSKYPERYGAWSMTNPEAAGSTLTEQDLRAQRARDEFGFDDEEDRLLRTAALNYLAQRAHAQGVIVISDEDYQTEFAARQDELNFQEEITFTGVQYPMDEVSPDVSQRTRAAAKAAMALDRLDKGLSFDDYLAQEKVARPAHVMEKSVIAYDPNSDKYREFWQVASGSQPGHILSTLLPPYMVATESGSGEILEVKQHGAAHLVFKILTRAPSRPKTFEEAKNDMAPRILNRKMMNRLRNDHGVVVNEEMLENPGGVGNQFKNSIIKTKVD